MSWSKVSYGFDVEEETRNFGTRAVALGHEAVFESTTLAVIESSDIESLNPKPWSLSKTHPHASFASVLDNSLNVFGTNLSQLLFSLGFSSLIEEIEWSEDGLFIFIGLQGGSLVALHVPTETLFKISSTLDASGDDINRRFFAKIKSFSTDTILDIIIVSSSRKIIRIYGSCVENIVECCTSQRDSGLRGKAVSSLVGTSVKVDVLCSPKYCNSEAIVAESSSSGSLVIFHSSIIEHWIVTDGSLDLINSAPLEEMVNVVQACITPDQRFVVCRLLNGALLFVDLYSLEPYCLWDEHFVVDFSVISFGEADCKILMLVRNDTSSFNFISYNYPEYSLYFKLPNISESSLPIGLHDCIYYLEYFGGDIIKTAKIKTIVESDPKSRLERLLHRGKFKEAEEFCRCFNLSMTEINQYKAKKIADDISVWKQGVLAESDMPIKETTVNDVEQLFETLISILDEIKDVDFIVELCITSVPCKLELIKKLLQYAISRLDKINSQEISNNIKHVEKVMDLMKLFRTFTELENIPHTPLMWAKFSPANFFKDCQNYISKGDVNSAVVLCRGYWSEMSVGLSPVTALSLLEMLPCKIPRTDMFLWLKTYLPLFLSLHEDSFQLCNKWIAQTITVISCLEKDIELCHDLVAEVHTILTNAFSGSQYLPFYLSVLSDYLVDTIKILKKLIYLKCEHGVTVPFERMPSSHSKEEKEELIFSILERIHYDDIEVLIKHFIDPYCSDHSLRCDEILLEYLLRLEAVGFPDVWKPQTDEILESRSIKFAEFIYNKSDKMKAIVYILKNAPVPWSETISAFEKTWYKASNIHERVEIANIKRIAIIQTVLLKYDIPRFELDTIDYGKINNILLYIINEANFENQRDLFNDIQQLGKIISQNSMMLFAYCTFLCESLSSGCTKEAIEILEAEVSEDILPAIYSMCIDKLIGLSDEWIHNSDYNKANVEILFSKIISKLPEKKLPTNFMEIINDLKLNYNVEVNVHDMKKKENKIAIASKCISKLLSSDNLAEETEKSKDYINNIRDLAVKLNIPFWSTCLELASQAVLANNPGTATDCIQCLIAENTDGSIPPVKIYDIVMQILCCGVTNSSRELYKHLASLIKTSSLKGLTGVTPDFVNKMTTCNIIMDLVQRDEFMKPVWFTNSIFVDAISYQPDIPHNRLSFLINLLSKKVFSNEREIKGVEILLYDLISQLPKCLHSAAASLRICLAFEELYYEQENSQQRIIRETDMKNIKGIIMHMISNTLLKTVYSNSFDLNVALSLLFYFPQDSALRWIDNVSFKTEQFRLHYLALLAQVYCALCNLPNHLNDYTELFTISKWNRQFKQHGISFENIFNNEAVILSTVKSLMKLPIFNCTLLEIFCSSFSCDYQEYLLIYLNHVLTSWKLDYIVEDDEFMVKHKYEDLYNKCLNIAFKIDMKPNQLCSYIFKSIWSRINPYYYEVYSVMINLIKGMDEDCYFDQLRSQEILLDFLLSYIRISKPGKREQEMWDYYDDLQLADLQIISKFRLPFRALPTDHWNFIAPELSLDNYKQWLVLPSWLDTELPSDLVCLFTVKNLQRQTIDSKEGWDLQLKRQDLLSKITECADRIDSLEIATTALYWAVNNAIPPGADQVEAAQHCLFRAQKWKKEEENSKSRAGFIKAEKKYMSIKIRHILHKYNLAKVEYLNLTTQPLELFRALYADSSIIDNFSNPGINDAARIIATSSIYTPELTDIKKELLMKWLTVSSNQADDSSDFEQENTRCFEDLKRAVYMLKGEEDPVYNTILHNSLFVEDENTKPIQIKLRSLQTLLSLMPHQNLFSTTGKSTEELLRSLETFQFVYDLERVGIFYAVDEFEAIPKDKVIVNLLMNPTLWRCVIAANMALAYNLKCSNIWNKIIGFFTSQNLANQLEKYLVRISKWSRTLLDLNILVNAWNTVIKSHIVKVERSSSNNEDFTSLLLNCPVLDKLDLSYLKGNSKFKINSLKYV